MPKVAGLLNIVAGGLGLFAAFAVVPLGFMWPDTDVYPVIFRVMFLLIIAGIFSIVGGIYALSRKKWGFALAGSIAALLPVLLPGIVSIAFIIQSKKEFQLRIST